MTPTLAQAAVLAEETTGIANILPDMAELVWGAVSFFILFAFVSKVAGPKIVRLLDERAERIQGQMEEAEQAREAAEQLRREYEERLSQARQEANEVIEQARQQAEQLKAQRTEAADREAEQILANARSEAEAERARLVQELRHQVASLSVEVAGQIVGRELDEDRHRDLVDRYIDDLASLN